MPDFINYKGVINFTNESYIKFRYALTVHLYEKTAASLYLNARQDNAKL